MNWEIIIAPGPTGRTALVVWIETNFKFSDYVNTMSEIDNILENLDDLDLRELEKTLVGSKGSVDDKLVPVHEPN